ncbi:MAG: phenylalanine--tRNA ligase subunit alpha [Candidatus Aenigmatarchaeota archaeon]
MYKLTAEGKRYLEKGLSEKRLVQLLDTPLKIDEIKKRLDDFNIAMTWAKKNRWIVIKEGKLHRAVMPKSTPEELGLRMVAENKKLDEKTTDLLLKRRLIEIERETITKKAEKQIGKEVKILTPELIKTGMWKKAVLTPYNVETAGKKVYFGKRHPYNQFLSEVRQKLVELGFKEMPGHLIETEFWNFDALFQAQNHPSRDWTETYSLKTPKTGSLPSSKIVANVKSSHENGWKTGSTGWGYKWDPKKAARLMPRAHTTACSARQLATGVDIPGKYFAISRCFRPDVIDATHGVEFNQAEGIVIDPNLNFKNMLGLLKMFVTEMTGIEKVRFYADYYPFTEPSAQVSAKHPELGWIELAGAGIFRPELTEPLGVNEPVIAWGFGIDRLAMLKLNIKDIRYLFARDLNWLRK